MTEHDLIIIGAGPAGATAAIYATRAGLKPVIFGGTAPGGQLLLTHEIENFPGFENPIAGFELMEHMHKQAKRLGAVIVNDEIVKAELDQRPFRLHVSDGGVHTAKALIIATGAQARWLGTESETRLRGKGVSACAVCDGFFYRGKEVCVVGGGDTAVGDALFLTKFASKVRLIHRRDQLRACPALAGAAKRNPKIEFVWDSVVEEVLGTDAVTGIKVRNVKTSAVSEISCSGLFMAIGHVPSTALFKGQLELDGEGYIKTSGVRTSVEGVFAAGDVMDPHYKQAVAAAGTGCLAALEAEKYLNLL